MSGFAGLPRGYYTCGCKVEYEEFTPCKMHYEMLIEGLKNDL